MLVYVERLIWYDARHEKDLKVFVVVIPKEGHTPILLLECHRPFENIIYDVRRVKFWKGGVRPKEGWVPPCTHPSFGMTTTKTLRSIFPWRASYVLVQWHKRLCGSFPSPKCLCCFKKGRYRPSFETLDYVLTQTDCGKVFRTIVTDNGAISLQEYETFWGRKTSSGCPQPKDYLQSFRTIY